jgi:Methyltransferase FkbM domain
MEHLRQVPTPLALWVAQHIERFTLLDVGCSGGLDTAWQDFGDRLVGYGFDPAAAEVARLQASETRSGVRYLPGFVVGERDGGAYWRRNPSARVSYSRTGALRRGERYALPSPIEPDDGPIRKPAPLGLGKGVVEGEIYLPTFLEREGVGDVDFVKIDVDGPDFEILKSLRETFERRRVLGVVLEVNFSGLMKAIITPSTIQTASCGLAGSNCSD